MTIFIITPNQPPANPNEPDLPKII